MNEFALVMWMAVDALPDVERWARNTVNQPNRYSIPYSGGNFYPDFVAELEDGRLLIVKHKGRMDESDREKDHVGRRLAEMAWGR